MWSSQGGCIKCCTSSVCLSLLCRYHVPCLRSTRNQKAIGTSSLMAALSWSLTGGQNLRSKIKGQTRSFERKCKNHLAYRLFGKSLSTYIKLIPKWSMTHSTLSNTFYQLKCEIVLIFVSSVCLSVCLSVCCMPVIYSTFERLRKFPLTSWHA